MKLTYTAKLLIRGTLIYYVLLLAIGFFFMTSDTTSQFLQWIFIPDNYRPYFFGLTLGIVTTILKIRGLDRDCTIALEMSSEGATDKIKLKALIRKFSTLGILLIGALFDSFDLWGVIIGIFSLQFSAYGVGFYMSKKGIKDGASVTDIKEEKISKSEKDTVYIDDDDSTQIDINEGGE